MKFKALFFFETKKNFKSFLIFTIVWVILIAFFMAFFNSLQASADELAKVYETMPKELLSALGKGIDQITTVNGYFGSSVVLYLMLSGCIFTVFIAGASLPGEIGNGNIIFLLSKPLTRVQIFVGKFLALVFNLLISNIILLITSAISIKLLATEGNLDINFVIITFSFLFLLELFFVGVAFFTGLLFDNGKAVALGSFSVFIFYIIKIASQLSDQIQFLKYFTVNHYLDIDALATNVNFKLGNIFAVLLIIILIITSAYLFSKKDINS